jgi:hypothetical protein
MFIQGLEYLQYTIIRQISHMQTVNGKIILYICIFAYLYLHNIFFYRRTLTLSAHTMQAFYAFGVSFPRLRWVYTHLHPPTPTYHIIVRAIVPIIVTLSPPIFCGDAKYHACEESECWRKDRSIPHVTPGYPLHPCCLRSHLSHK